MSANNLSSDFGHLSAILPYIFFSLALSKSISLFPQIDWFSYSTSSYWKHPRRHYFYFETFCMKPAALVVERERRRDTHTLHTNFDFVMNLRFGVSFFFFIFGLQWICGLNIELCATWTSEWDIFNLIQWNYKILSCMKDFLFAFWLGRSCLVAFRQTAVELCAFQLLHWTFFVFR